MQILATGVANRSVYWISGQGNGLLETQSRGPRWGLGTMSSAPRLTLLDHLLAKQAAAGSPEKNQLDKNKPASLMKQLSLSLRACLK